ncbi:MAG: DUF2948 family protein [Pseudomonadota bacterium]
MSGHNDKMLKMIALDEEDLKVISAHIQDAVMRIGDLNYLPKENRFALVFNRFVWEKEATSNKAPKQNHERRRSALHFERVKKVQTRNIRRDSEDAVINLLAVSFTESDAPAGSIDLVFSGDGVVRLEVDYIEAQFSDLGGSWETQSMPHHGTETDAE